jgi:hypothetical protein
MYIIDIQLAPDSQQSEGRERANRDVNLILKLPQLNLDAFAIRKLLFVLQAPGPNGIIYKDIKLSPNCISLDRCKVRHCLMSHRLRG